MTVGDLIRMADQLRNTPPDVEIVMLDPRDDRYYSVHGWAELGGGPLRCPDRDAVYFAIRPDGLADWSLGS